MYCQNQQTDQPQSPYGTMSQNYIIINSSHTATTEYLSVILANENWVSGQWSWQKQNGLTMQTQDCINMCCVLATDLTACSVYQARRQTKFVL